MATSPPSSSPSNSRQAGSFHTAAGDRNDAADDSVPAEALVEHLLAAKRALSSMTLLMRANTLSTDARQLHEDSVVLGAQTAFMRKAIASEGRLLRRIKDNLIITYDASASELKFMLKSLDGAYIKLQETIDVLRGTVVDPVFRPEGEEPKNLHDFVDEKAVDGLRDSLMASISELQVSPGSCTQAFFPSFSPLFKSTKLTAVHASFSKPKNRSAVTFRTSTRIYTNYHRYFSRSMCLKTSRPLLPRIVPNKLRCSNSLAP